MTLRKRIELIVRQHAADPVAAALKICLLLEEEVGLAGNGWFDNDKEALAAMGYGTDDK